MQVRGLVPLTREFRLLRLSPHASCIEYSCEDCPSVSGPCFEFRVQRHAVLDHQPLLHPSTTLVGFSQRVFSNGVTFGSFAKPKLGVETTRDDCSMFFSLNACVHLFDVNVRIPCVVKTDTSQHYPSWLVLSLTHSVCMVFRFHILLNSIRTPCF